MQVPTHGFVRNGDILTNRTFAALLTLLQHTSSTPLVPTTRRIAACPLLLILISPRMTSDDTPSMSIHALLVATRNNLRMTMWTSQWPTKEQLPISSSRTVESNPVPNPITLLNPFPAMWTNCLVVSCPNKRASHDKHKDNADHTNGHHSRERQGRLLKPRRNHRHTDKNEQNQGVPNNG